MERRLARCSRARLCLEIGLLVEAVAEEASEEGRRKTVALGVDLARRIVEAHALDRNAVLGALELRLQVAEVRRRLELGVLLRNDEQPRQRRRELSLRLFEIAKGLRIAGHVLERFRRDFADL